MYNTDSLRIAYLYTEGVKTLALDEIYATAVARLYFDKVLEIDSLHAPTHHQLSEMTNNSLEALPHCEIAYAADSTNLDYAEHYCYMLYDSEEYNKAKVVCQRIIDQDPQNPMAWRTMAALHVATNMPHLALGVLDSAEYKIGRHREFSEYKIALLSALKLYDRAIGEMQVNIANNPRDVQNYVVLGELYAQADRDSLAEVSFLKALELAPENINATIRLSTFYHKNGQGEKFLQQIKKLFLSDQLSVEDKRYIYDSMVVADEEFYRRHFFTINSLISILNVKHPDDGELKLRHARHLIRAGELEQALAKYKSLSMSEWAPMEAFHGVVSIEEHFGRRDSMMHYLDLAIEKYPSEMEFRFRKGFELLNEEGREKEAKRVFEEVVEVAEDDESKSVAYAALGDQEITLKGAARYYRKALQHNPENAGVLNNWAYKICTNGGDLNEALQMSTKACDLEPTEAIYLDTKAWTLYLLGRTSEAKTIMRRAISLDSTGDSTLLLHYGDILAAEGEKFMAEIYYKRALEAGEDPEMIEERMARLKEETKR